jgi:hypothetical protein
MLRALLVWHVVIKKELKKHSENEKPENVLEKKFRLKV